MDEWTKLQQLNKVQATAEEAWSLLVQTAHDEVLAGLWD